jgi:hypothetical protein
MLRPNKHSDPQLTVLPVAGELLKKLRQKRSCTLPDLRKYVEGLGTDRVPLLLPSLAVLFILGLVEYRRKTDCMEYVGP